MIIRTNIVGGKTVIEPDSPAPVVPERPEPILSAPLTLAQARAVERVRAAGPRGLMLFFVERREQRVFDAAENKGAITLCGTGRSAYYYFESHRIPEGWKRLRDIQLRDLHA